MKATLAVVAVGAGLLATSAADAATVTVTDAIVRNGTLTVSGKTPQANQKVTLDDQFTTKSNGQREFTFALSDYLPPDCIVDVKADGAIGSGVVANCGPRGVSPRGAWKRGNDYLADDLVTFAGSSWRAKVANSGRRPDTHPQQWELFA
jgi:hypothetical protein